MEDNLGILQAQGNFRTWHGGMREKSSPEYVILDDGGEEVTGVRGEGALPVILKLLSTVAWFRGTSQEGSGEPVLIYQLSPLASKIYLSLLL